MLQAVIGHPAGLVRHAHVVHVLQTTVICAVTFPGMKKAVVISVDEARSLFAIKAADGRCAVFCQSGGARVGLGEMLTGDVLGRGVRALRSSEGTCWAVGDTGPIPMSEALQLVRGASLVEAGSANDQDFLPHLCAGS